MTEPGVVTRVLPERSRSPHHTGRHVQHDPRSLRFAAPVLPKSAIRSVRWTRQVDTFNQADYSSCVGMAFGGWAATDNATRTGLTHVNGTPVDMPWARDVVYHLATERDEFDWTWPSQDSGSSGIGGAKAIQSLGLCGGYTHGFTPAALHAALQVQPVPIGVGWFGSMWEPTAAGQVVVDTTSGLAWGHEVLVDELDVEHDRVWFQNSWSASWGREGRAWFSFADLAVLLAADGDVTIPTPLAVAPPEPAPAEPSGCLGQFTRVLRRGAR